MSEQETEMLTERELAEELYEACRTLLRYDGIDRERVTRAVADIRAITTEWRELQDGLRIEREGIDRTSKM